MFWLKRDKGRRSDSERVEMLAASKPGWGKARPHLTAACLLGAIVALLAVYGWLLQIDHKNTQENVERSSLNVVEAAATAIRRDFESISLSMDGTIKALQEPDIWSLPNGLMQLALFDASIRLNGLSSILIIDKDGRLRGMSGNTAPPAINLGDRDYFEHHRDHPTTGVFITGPTPSRLNGRDVLILSKRVNDAHGNFAGVVATGIFTSHFNELFGDFDAGAHGSVALVSTGGRVVTRLPFDPQAGRVNLLQTSAMTEMERRAAGTFVGVSQIDGEERLAAFRHIDEFPFIVTFSRATREVFAGWWSRVTTVIPIMLALSAFILILLWENRQELRRRRRAEQNATLAAQAVSVINLDLERRVQQQIEAQKASLEQLAASQRLEALGQLAGGIAHDINNVLQTISGACGLLQSRGRAADEVQRFASLALGAADRGSAITRRLLVFARRAGVEAEAVDVRAVLEDMQELLNHTLGGSTHIELDLESDLPAVAVDRMQFETVIINLATNARDAMAGGGTITISARTEVRSPAGPGPDASSPTCFVRLSVIDTGVGMSPSTLMRCLEPFFTTKGVGKGTGLGLSMAKGFADQAGGQFEIHSELGHGTTVTLLFPIADRVVRDEVPQTAKAVRGPNVPIAVSKGDASSILLVDDNVEARELLAELLRNLGLTIHQAGSGEEALSRLTSDAPIDLLVTDLSMPKMNGVELIHAVRKHIPDLPAIILTGNTSAVASLAIEEVAGGRCLILQKPVHVADLQAHINVVMSPAALAAALAVFAGSGIPVPT